MSLTSGSATSSISLPASIEPMLASRAPRPFHSPDPLLSPKWAGLRARAVRPGAQQTVAHQGNKNLRLVDGAEAETQPKLEIFADDVTCTHGAAVGQLDPAAMFYLKSRGIGEAVARALLVHGFVREVVDSIADDAVRQYTDDAVMAALRAG